MYEYHRKNSKIHATVVVDDERSTATCRTRCNHPQDPSPLSLRKYLKNTTVTDRTCIRCRARHCASTMPKNCTCENSTVFCIQASDRRRIAGPCRCRSGTSTTSPCTCGTTGLLHKLPCSYKSQPGFSTNLSMNALYDLNCKIQRCKIPRTSTMPNILCSPGLAVDSI